MPTVDPDRLRSLREDYGDLAAELEQVPTDAAGGLGRLEAALAPTCASLRETLAD